MTVYRLNALDETGARLHIIGVLGIAGAPSGIVSAPLLVTTYTHPAPPESPGPVEDYCDVCNEALKELNP